MKYLKEYKIFESDNKYMIPRVNNVPNAIKSYADVIYKDFENNFNKWFFRKSLANYSEEITYQWDDIKDLISENDFKDFPIEDLCIDLKFTLSKDLDNYQEGGAYKKILDDMMNFEEYSFKQKSFTGIVDESYYIRYEFSIIFPRKFSSIDTNELKQRIKSMIYHEVAHTYDDVKNGKVTTARGHLIKPENLEYLSTASIAIRDLIYLSYISSPEEIYANMIGSYGFNSFEDYKKHWIYDHIVKMKNFKAQDFIDQITKELPKNAVWESNDFGDTRFYKLPEDFPKLFADYHDIILEQFDYYGIIRPDYDHKRYSDLRNLSLEEFAKYWEEEFHTAAEIYEEDINKVINSKK